MTAWSLTRLLLRKGLLAPGFPGNLIYLISVQLRLGDDPRSFSSGCYLKIGAQLDAKLSLSGKTEPGAIRCLLTREAFPEGPGRCPCPGPISGGIYGDSCLFHTTHWPESPSLCFLFSSLFQTNMSKYQKLTGHPGFPGFAWHMLF